MKRRYSRYVIRVKDSEGERVLKLNRNVDLSRFSIAKQSYDKTKDVYSNKNEDSTVELVGVTEDGELGNVIYSKEFTKELIVEDEELLIKTDELVESIKHSLEILLRKKQYHSDLICALHKKQDVMLHNIENLSQLDNNSKLNVISELEQLRKYRRLHKNEEKKLKVLDSIINLKEINDLFEKVEVPIEEQDFKFFTEKELDNMNIIKEVVYTSQKDKDNKMETLKKKYDEIVVDKAKNLIICYNRGFAGNKNKKIK